MAAQNHPNAIKRKASASGVRRLARPANDNARGAASTIPRHGVRKGGSSNSLIKHPIRALAVGRNFGLVTGEGTYTLGSLNGLKSNIGYAKSLSQLQRISARDISTALTGGGVSLKQIRKLIPANRELPFTKSQRIDEGYKYRFFLKGQRVEIKWHSPDRGAPVGSNSRKMWTAQVQIGGKYLGSDGKLYRNAKQNITHIPLYE
ncbi:polymorphic toxin type 30 domain-containing protein [Mesorhizobium australicum]|nr:polymorphic toxin type 30 domain-containing protein [Mesorhizobium australicum]